VVGNIVAKLAENAEFGGGWNFYVIHDLPCGRFSAKFQPFFLNSCGMAVIYFGEWAAGKIFALCAWNSGDPDLAVWQLQVVGDPFVER
jgi:hypothetical protein